MLQGDAGGAAHHRCGGHGVQGLVLQGGKGVPSAVARRVERQHYTSYLYTCVHVWQSIHWVSAADKVCGASCLRRYTPCSSTAGSGRSTLQR